ncbi:MAG TPA: metallophosphoesterase [Candidatus Bathyarchaeia archaeon]|nr:metallophosphoesterase [Candidatus Bathyarchaeia archaeon]
MKISIFSDIHGDLRTLEERAAEPADIHIAAGDLATFGKGLDRCAEILKPLGGRLWLLPGNHETHEQTRAYCERFGFVDFHRQVKTLNGTNGPSTWAGLGYSSITPFNTPGEYSEQEFAEALAKFDGYSGLYLVAHCPPAKTRLDEFAPGKHGGSTALRAWIERAKPSYVFCGHIHETAGLSEQLGATQCINVGKRGYTIEI